MTLIKELIDIRKRLVPLPASIVELLPWLTKRHHELDLDYNQCMDDAFEGLFVLDPSQVVAIQPPAN